MPKTLTEAQIAQFRRDGYLAPLRVVPEAAARDMRRQLEAFEAERGGPLKGSVRFKSHLLFKWLNDLIRTPAILDVVEDIIGPDILVWSTDWSIKEARSPSFVSWHQDSQYWGLDTTRLVTVWVALSPSTVESGCMRVLPGSHQGPDLRHQETFHDDNLLTRGQEIVEGIDEEKIGEPGGATPARPPCSPSASPTPRTPTAATTAASAWPSATFHRTRARPWPSATWPPWCAGRDTSGYFEHEPVPTRDFDPDVVAFHARAEEHRREILYHGTGWTSHRT